MFKRTILKTQKPSEPQKPKTQELPYQKLKTNLVIVFIVLICNNVDYAYENGHREKNTRIEL